MANFITITDHANTKHSINVAHIIDVTNYGQRGCTIVITGHKMIVTLCMFDDVMDQINDD